MHYFRHLLSGIVLAALLAQPATAQVFNKDYEFSLESEIETLSSEVSVRVPFDGSFITVGSQRTVNNQFYALLMRVDSHGNLIWARSYGDSASNDRGHSLTLSHDGKDVLFTGTAGGDLWIVRVDVNFGNVLWSHVYGDPSSREEGKVIRAVDDNFGEGYLVAGTIPAGADQALYMIRIDEDGIPQYQQRYDGASVSEYIVQPTAMLGDHEDILLTGIHTRDGDQPELFVLPLRSSTGIHQDMVHYEQSSSGGSAHRSPMLAPAEDGFMAAYSVTAMGSATPRIAALRIDSNLDPLWERRYTATGVSSGPFQDASWGVSIHPSEKGYALGVGLGDRIFSGLLFIADDGTPLSLHHYVDEGFTKPWVAMGDTVAPMAADEGGFLLKNHMPLGVRLTRVDPGGFAPCEEPPPVSDQEFELTRRETEYVRYDWGDVAEQPIKAIDLKVSETKCP